MMNKEAIKNAKIVFGRELDNKIERELAHGLAMSIAKEATKGKHENRRKNKRSKDSVLVVDSNIKIGLIENPESIKGLIIPFDKDKTK